MEDHPLFLEYEARYRHLEDLAAAEKRRLIREAGLDDSPGNGPFRTAKEVLTRFLSRTAPKAAGTVSYGSSRPSRALEAK